MLRLSRSDTVTTMVPDIGKPPTVASSPLAKAIGRFTPSPIASPVERISGPRTVSTVLPLKVRKRRKGSTTSFTAISGQLR